MEFNEFALAFLPTAIHPNVVDVDEVLYNLKILPVVEVDVHPNPVTWFTAVDLTVIPNHGALAYARGNSISCVVTALAVGVNVAEPH